MGTNNCVYPQGTGEADPKNFGGDGYEHYANKFVNPLYVDREAENFTLSANTGCAGMGPQDPDPPNTAPTITMVRPANGSVTSDRTPTIEATVTDAETELVEASTRLLVDGKRIAG